MKPFTRKIIPTATREVGVREVPPGSNAGPRVEEYLASIGLDAGPPWCAAFVHFISNEVARSFGVDNPLPRTGYCPSLQRFAQVKGILKDEPEAGDVFLLFGSPEGYRRASHTGFVTSVAGDVFQTVEGNTNDGGGREGVGVFARRRRVTPGRYKFIRVDAVAPAVTQTAPTPALTKAPKVKVHIGTPYSLILNSRKVLDLPVRDGRTWCPIKSWCAHLGFSCTWDVEKQLYLFNGHEAPLDVLKIEIAGTPWAYAPIRQLVRAAGLKLAVDTVRKTVTVSR